jgi:NTE family protein
MYNFKNIVFEGGGVKGIAYGGALEILEKKGILPQITRVAGTSAGAITATLLALGYDYKEVTNIISKADFNKFEDKSSFLINLLRLLRKYGWFKGDYFTEWIGELIKEKTGDTNYSFSDLKKSLDGNKKGFRDLYTVSTDLSLQNTIICSHETEEYGSMPIRNAVRMSMSIPFFFKAVNNKGNIIVDGGIAWNYPINIFDFKKYLSNTENGEVVKYYTEEPDYRFNHETLGFRLDNKKEIDYNKHHWGNVPKKITFIHNYSQAIYSFASEMLNKSHLHNNDWNRTIFIDTMDVKTTDFDLMEDTKNSLIESGKEGVREYFEWRDQTHYILF